MNTIATRTAGPFTYEGDWSPEIVSRSAQETIATVAWTGDKESTNANGKFIVTACNAHDDLIEALRVIANSYGPATDLENVLMFRDIARAALTKVNNA